MDSTKSPMRRRQNWATAGRFLYPGGQARARRVAPGAGYRVSNGSEALKPTSWRNLVCAASAARHSTTATHSTVPLLAGDHVTDDTGTGFVHTAPGHGARGFRCLDCERSEACGARHQHRHSLHRRRRRPLHRTGAGLYRQARAHRQRREGRRQRGGDQGFDRRRHADRARAARSINIRIRWRSKKPVIFRNTPQWFIAMDTADRVVERSAKGGRTLRQLALEAIEQTRWVPAQGENRITGMIETRPDWVISRQRAWGVPIAVFIKDKPDGSVEILDDPDVNARIVDAFEAEGADAWYAAGARERFLGKLANEDWQKVDDILDVWFNSGSTHAFVLEDPEHFPALAGIQPQGRRRRRNRDVSRRLRPASRLVSVFAARNPAARAAARRSTSCSPMASCSTSTAAKCRNRSATSRRRRT